jgi:hypothetical protein
MKEAIVVIWAFIFYIKKLKFYIELMLVPTGLFILLFLGPVSNIMKKKGYDLVLTSFHTTIYKFSFYSFLSGLGN